jgi:hypothetical protein
MRILLGFAVILILITSRNANRIELPAEPLSEYF